MVKQRRFGRTNWQVSEIGYGMWGMGGWTGSDDTESSESLQFALDSGCNFFDTAWAYGEGHSERLLGKLVAANPDKRIHTATKVPPKNRKWPSRRQNLLDDCFPPAYIHEYVDKSLANLGLPTLDLIQLHTWEDGWLDDERLKDAFIALRKSGKVRAIGISINRWEPWNGIRAVESGLIDAVQVVYNIFDQNPEDALFPACRKHDVAVIARVPFDEGSLTGTLTADSTWPRGDFRNAYFTKENLTATLPRVKALLPVLPPGSTLPEVALRFILNSVDVSTIIPGMRKRKHVESNLAASTAGPLPADLYETLRGHRWVRDSGQNRA